MSQLVVVAYLVLKSFELTFESVVLGYKSITAIDLLVAEWVAGVACLVNLCSNGQPNRSQQLNELLHFDEKQLH